MTDPHGKVILVTGPSRSGKSEWAEHLAHQSGKPVTYIATAQADISDGEWQARLDRHRERRPPTWHTLEIPTNISQVIATAEAGNCLLVDALGTWVANWLEQPDMVWLEIQGELLVALGAASAEVILVAEETGWGVVPPYPLGRVFRDRLGDLIRQVGAIAHAVYLTSGGYALNLSLLGTPLPIPTPSLS